MLNVEIDDKRGGDVKPWLLAKTKSSWWVQDSESLIQRPKATMSKWSPCRTKINIYTILYIFNHIQLPSRPMCEFLCFFLPVTTFESSALGKQCLRCTSHPESGSQWPHSWNYGAPLLVFFEKKTHQNRKPNIHCRRSWYYSYSYRSQISI